MADLIFAQFVRPAGQVRTYIVEVSVGIAEQSERLRRAGCTLECEVLGGGQVVLVVEQNDVFGGSRTLASEQVQDGPLVPAVVARLITNAIAQLDLWERPAVQTTAAATGCPSCS